VQAENLLLNRLVHNRDIHKVMKRQHHEGLAGERRPKDKGEFADISNVTLSLGPCLTL
jgi:hypothetical protein